MMDARRKAVVVSLLMVGCVGSLFPHPLLAGRTAASHLLTGDSLGAFSTQVDSEIPAYRNAWGVDILISNGGFGLGGFYRREFSDEWYGFVTLSISESKDDREFEQYDIFTNTSFTPGKLNRFMVIPLTFGVQHRLFREEITDNFRPFVNAGAGPAMIFVAPFTEVRQTTGGVVEFRQVEFFKSLGRGHPHYTLSGFIGIGANFGLEKSNLLGVNFRYYFTYLLSGGLPSLYNMRTGGISGSKNDFGGFFITLNLGLAY
jgi:hypothetical protein